MRTIKCMDLEVESLRNIDFAKEHVILEKNISPSINSERDDKIVKTEQPKHFQIEEEAPIIHLEDTMGESSVTESVPVVEELNLQSSKTDNLIQAVETTTSFSGDILETTTSFSEGTVTDSSATVSIHTTSPQSNTAFQLVLSLTAETSESTVPAKIINTIQMLSLYQLHFPFRAVMFSQSPSIQQLCVSYNITVHSTIRTNSYKIPILKNMIIDSRTLFPADYYGYINSDILFTPNLFTMLTILQERVQQEKLDPIHLIASRVYDVARQVEPDFTSVSSFAKSLKALPKRYGLRNENSADIFIFSKRYPVKRMEKAVIGRRKIDSYVMYFAYINKLTLIDISTSLVGIHQGRDTYKNHVKNKSNDYYYNSMFYSDRNQKKASLKNCRFRFEKKDGELVLSRCIKKT